MGEDRVVPQQTVGVVYRCVGRAGGEEGVGECDFGGVLGDVGLDAEGGVEGAEGGEEGGGAGDGEAGGEDGLDEGWPGGRGR